MDALTQEIKQSAQSFGFDAVTISSARPLEQDAQRYKDWCKQGFAADLHYMTREHPRRWVAQDLLPSARSVISLAVNFYGEPYTLAPRQGFGRVARYAWGLDYHDVLLQRLKDWNAELKNSLGHLESKILIDSSPLLERAFAAQSNMGFIGKNTLLISRKLGSFVFLAELLVNLELTPDPPAPSLALDKDACGSCRQCLVDCPTGALVAPRSLDARKCISYWTIENKKEIVESMQAGIGDWIFGCDVCQEVCPYEGISPPRRWPEFAPESGCGPYLSLLELFELKDDAAFKQKFKATPLLRAKRAGLLRNACVVAANQKFAAALPHLKKLAQSSNDPMLQTHANWAIQKIDS